MNHVFPIEHIKDAWDNQAPARMHAERKRKMFNNDWKDWLLDEIYKLFTPQTYEKIKQRVDTSVNLFRWVITELAAVYSKPVHREFETAILEPMPEVDMALQLADFWTMAMGEALVRPIWAGGRMQCLIYPRDRFLAIPAQEDPLTLKAVVIEHRDPKGNISHFEVWTDENQYKLDESWRVKKEKAVTKLEDGSEVEVELEPVNPYQVVPFLCFHSEYPAAAFWHGGTSDDLAQANLGMGVDLTDFSHLKHFQSYKQVWIKRDGKEDKSLTKIKTDPTAIVELKGANASAGVLDLQANLIGNLQVTLEKSQYTAGLHGSRPTLIRGEETASSGYALKIKEHKKAEFWAKLRQLRELDEQQLWRIARVTVPADGGPAIPEGRVSIDWPELGPGQDPQEMATYANTIMPIVGEKEAMRQLGYSEEEIERIVLEKIEEEARKAPAFGMNPFGGGVE